MVEVCGKGQDILAFFNIDYHEYIKEISDELMRNPNKKYKLTLERVSK